VKDFTLSESSRNYHHRPVSNTYSQPTGSSSPAIVLLPVQMFSLIGAQKYRFPHRGRRNTAWRWA
jgi:hypothetical protein